MVRAVRSACLAILCGVMCAAISACTSDLERYEYYLAPDHSGASDERVLLLPVGFNGALPPEVREGAETLQREIESYLKSRGHALETLSMADAQALWREVAPGLMASLKRDPAGLKTGQVKLVRRLSSERSFDSVIFTKLSQRTTTVQSKSAAWDGVKRFVRLHNKPRGMTFNLDGSTIPGLSLHVTVYSPDATRLFESYGGLEVTIYVQVDARSGAHDIVERTDLLEDPETMREAIQIAFDPYVPTVTGP